VHFLSTALVPTDIQFGVEVIAVVLRVEILPRSTFEKSHATVCVRFVPYESDYWQLLQCHVFIGSSPQ